jgi:hypothetical protein
MAERAGNAVTVLACGSADLELFEPSTEMIRKGKAFA